MSEPLVLAVAIGIAFGWTLERAGLGSAPKLAGQFYLTDFTVFKVMFSAIVTAMLGVFWLSRLGILDLSRLYVPETYLMPQLGGGLLFGAGFVIAGLCPGTSCVAAATGRGDGALVMLGMFSGVLATGLAFAPLQHFYESTPRGSLTLPDLLHLRYGVVVCAVVVMALIAFTLLRRLSGDAARPIPAAYICAIGGLLLAFLGLFGDISRRTAITPVVLAEWIKERKPDLRIIDVRSESEFDEYHLPRSERMASLAPASFKPEETIVLVSGGALPGRQVYILRGGVSGWIDEVMNPTITENATPEARAAFQRASIVSRYFGGIPRVVDKLPAARPNAAYVRRRGC